MRASPPERDTGSSQSGARKWSVRQVTSRANPIVVPRKLREAGVWMRSWSSRESLGLHGEPATLALCPPVHSKVSMLA